MRQPRWVAAISLLVAAVWLASEVSAQIPVVGGGKFQGLKWTFVRIKYGSFPGEGTGNGRNSQLAYWDDPWAIDAPAAEQDWAPLSYTFAGVWEIQPNVLEEYLERVTVIDVREPDEYSGAFGHILGAKLVPLGSLVARLEELPKDKPLVMVCRSGARSAQATVLLKNKGIAKVANLAGGMLRWRAQRFPAEGGAD